MVENKESQTGTCYPKKSRFACWHQRTYETSSVHQDEMNGYGPIKWNQHKVRSNNYFNNQRIKEQVKQWNCEPKNFNKMKGDSKVNFKNQTKNKSKNQRIGKSVNPSIRPSNDESSEQAGKQGQRSINQAMIPNQSTIQPIINPSITFSSRRNLELDGITNATFDTKRLSSTCSFSSRVAHAGRKTLQDWWAPWPWAVELVQAMGINGPQRSRFHCFNRL